MFSLNLLIYCMKINVSGMALDQLKGLKIDLSARKKLSLKYLMSLRGNAFNLYWRDEDDFEPYSVSGQGQEEWTLHWNAFPYNLGQNCVSFLVGIVVICNYHICLLTLHFLPPSPLTPIVWQQKQKQKQKLPSKALTMSNLAFRMFTLISYCSSFQGDILEFSLYWMEMQCMHWG